MRYNLGLKGSMICFIIGLFIVFSASERERSLVCSKVSDFCRIDSVLHLGNKKSTQLIPVSEIKEVEYVVKKAGNLSRNPDDYVGIIYFIPKTGNCTFEIYRKFSDSKIGIEDKMKKLANEISYSLENGKEDFVIQLYSAK